MKDSDPANGPKSQKGQGKGNNSRNEQPSSPKCAVATRVKKTKDGNWEDATSTISNGSLILTSGSKQPFALATNRGSSSCRQAIKGNESVDSGTNARSTSAPNSVLDYKVKLLFFCPCYFTSIVSNVK